MSLPETDQYLPERCEPQGSAEDSSCDATRQELIKLSEEGEISQSVKHLKKASNKTIEKLYAEYERKQADQASTFLADTLITKFSELMCGLDVVSSDPEFTSELRGDKLLQKNIKSAVSFIAPFIPFIGLITGGVILGKHTMKHRTAGPTGPTGSRRPEPTGEPEFTED